MHPGDGAGHADSFGVATGGAPYDASEETQAQAIREDELRERARLARQAQRQGRSRLNRRVHHG